MTKVLLKKLFQILITLLGASLIAFFLIRWIPGDPVTNLLGERGGDPEVVAQMRQTLGIDQPITTQYFLFLKNALKGDLGSSIVSKRPVSEEFFARFPATVELALMGLLIASLIGIPLGLIAAVKKGTLFDFGIMGTALVGYSMPIFWWGLILILFFSVQLGWFPVSGRIDIVYDVPAWTGFYFIDIFKLDEVWPAFKSAIHHLILPAFVLGTIPLAAIARMTRSSLLEVMGEDYVRTAKAKGLSHFRVVFVHAFRNALIPVVTVVGLMLGSLLTGAVLTETIFSWPGIGRWLVKSVEARDYPVIQGGVLYLALIVVTVNLLVDGLYIWISPRMRKK